MMMWVIWLSMSVLSAVSGIVSSRRYLNSQPGARGNVLFYQVVAALNYVLFAFGLSVMGWYGLALGQYAESLVFWLQGIACVMNVCIALSALRKAARILRENGVSLNQRRSPKQKEA